MNATEELPSADYERRDAWPRAIVLTALCIAAIVGGVLAISAWIYRTHYRYLTTASADAVDRSFRHGSEERTGIARDWAEQDRRVREHLTTYGWIDRHAGVARIPIERAMELVAADAAARPEKKPNP